MADQMTTRGDSPFGLSLLQGFYGPRMQDPVDYLRRLGLEKTGEPGMPQYGTTSAASLPPEQQLVMKRERRSPAATPFYFSGRGIEPVPSGLRRHPELAQFDPPDDHIAILRDWRLEFKGKNTGKDAFGKSSQPTLLQDNEGYRKLQARLRGYTDAQADFSPPDATQRDAPRNPGYGAYTAPSVPTAPAVGETGYSPKQTVPELRNAPPLTWKEKFWGMFRSPDEEIAKAQNAYAISQEFDIPLAEAYKYHDEIAEELGLNTDGSPTELFGAAAIPAIAFGLMEAPLATLLGIAAFETLGEAESYAIALALDEDYQLFQKKGLTDLLPDDANRLTVKVVETLDIAAKVLAARGIHKKAPAFREAIFREIITKHKLPKTIYIDPAKLKLELQRGNILPAEEMDMVKSLGLSGSQYRTAIKKGISIEVPSEKITTIQDRSWYAKTKKMFGLEPFKEVRTQGGKPVSYRFSDMEPAVKAQLQYNLPKGTIAGGVKEIGQLHDQVVRGKIPGNVKRAVRFQIVDRLEARWLKQKTGLNLEGYKHTVDSFGIIHAYGEHGNAKAEAARGQAAITKEDFEKIPDIITNYDDVRIIGKNSVGNDLLQYRKRYEGVIYYVEEIRTKRRELITKTLWKTRTASDAPPLQESPSVRPKPFSRSLPDKVK